MTATLDEKDPAGPGPTPDDESRARGAAHPARSLIGLVGLVITALVMVNTFQAFRLYDINKFLQAPIGIVIGVGGSAALFYFINMLVEGFPRRWEAGIKPYVFLLPALAFISVILIYPTVQTFVNSFANDESTEWVGWANYRDVLGDPAFRETLFNNLLWLIIVPASTVFFGLIVAVLADRLSVRGEKIAKSMIFLPMAISFVGAATIWKFIYDLNAGREQIGLLNGIMVGLGFDPVSWLSTQTFQLNDILLMVILIWAQVGFSMVLLSAAIKGVPEETLEAARIDGASELKIFFLVTVPQIRVTITAVFVTVVILVLKVFDVVFVMTNGRDGTSLIALDFYRQIFDFGNAGVASAIVVLLTFAVVPVLIYQIRSFRQEEALR